MRKYVVLTQEPTAQQYADSIQTPETVRYDDTQQTYILKYKGDKPASLNTAIELTKIQIHTEIEKTKWDRGDNEMPKTTKKGKKRQR